MIEIREKRQMTPMKEIKIHILCPICGRGRLMDAVSNTSAAKLSLYGPQQLSKAEWIIKCPKCGNQIGIASKPSKTEYEKQRARV